MIKRLIEQKILARLQKRKIISVLGARQVGKTTLVKSLAEKSGLSYLYWSGDEFDIREILSMPSTTRLKTLIGNKQLVIIDEAQRISNIGITLKLLADNLPDVQIIVTGSSSLELASEINEPLTGRKYEYFLYPLAFQELVNTQSLLDENRLLEHRLIYGSYPEIVTHPGEEVELLNLLTNSYLYKDLFVSGQIKKHPLLEKIVQALALQIGSEVSYRELGQTVGADNETVERYIDLLEKTFIIFRLTALNRNLRNELKKSRKIYFCDNGVRNTIIKNFNPLALRQDKGALWENYLISERIKANHLSGKWINQWFWRTHSQQELDYIEEYNGQLHAFEFKWKPTRGFRPSKTFIDAYPASQFALITPENYSEFLSVE